MTKITPELILRLNRAHPAPQVAAEKLQAAADRYNINTPRRVAMFLGQLTHESGLVPAVENLSYSALRISQVWPSRFPSVGAAQPYAHNPQALGNNVYAGRMGNYAPGDGFLFRGRGFIQITGRDMYALMFKLTGFDVVSNPDMACQYGVGSVIAGAYWNEHGLNEKADAGNVVAVTRAINGGLIGLDSREALYQRALNNIPRYGLLDTDTPLDVDGDQKAQDEQREATFNELLGVIGE